MDKFIPREKLSKKKQRELDRQARRDWNGLNPATRRPEDPKIYNRKKIRRDDYGDHSQPDFLLCSAGHTPKVVIPKRKRGTFAPVSAICTLLLDNAVQQHNT